MADSGTRTRNLWFPENGDTPHTSFKQDTKNLAHHGQDQEKEKTSDYRI